MWKWGVEAGVMAHQHMYLKMPYKRWLRLTRRRATLQGLAQEVGELVRLGVAHRCMSRWRFRYERRPFPRPLRRRARRLNAELAAENTYSLHLLYRM